MKNICLSKELLTKIGKEEYFQEVMIAIYNYEDSYETIEYMHTQLPGDLKYDLIRFLKTNRNLLVEMDSINRIALYTKEDVFEEFLKPEYRDFIRKFVAHEKIENTSADTISIIKNLLWYVFEEPSWFANYDLNGYSYGIDAVRNFVRKIHENIAFEKRLKKISEHRMVGLQSRTLKLVRQLFVYNMDPFNLSEEQIQLLTKTTPFKDEHSVRHYAKVNSPVIATLEYMEKQILKHTENKKTQ